MNILKYLNRKPNPTLTLDKLLSSKAIQLDSYLDREFGDSQIGTRVIFCGKWVSQAQLAKALSTDKQTVYKSIKTLADQHLEYQMYPSAWDNFRKADCDLTSKFKRMIGGL
ncbi:hypothetical protein [Shewanella sp. UCD-KL21]|uniref:hypothetical protein n=1 Tax=Shewanella sp. UCD-KL21 TaxID=1917164 RepID=UPI0009711532|nr:hypothetical protein [Shewanella sp. UCD-KL21]